ncbi:hypothetical protein HRbin10_02534 [bacterium HR10]|nr:hypothetical protein HRbin10_02534 [bacterium HR10]
MKPAVFNPSPTLKVLGEGNFASISIMRGSGPMPAGSFAKILYVRMHPNSVGVAHMRTPGRSAPVTGSTNRGEFRVMMTPSRMRGFAGSGTK